jgi:hypothetical protein
MNKISKILVALTAMLAAGCAESTSAPKAPASRDVTIPGGGATAALTGSDTIRFSVYIDPSRSITYNLGAGNSITFPAGSLCALNSTYGGGQWDKPCAVATSPVTVYTKAWLDAQGFAHVDFDKHIRFVPTSNPAGWVMLSLYDYGAMTTPWTKINYCPSPDASSCIDESKNDPSVATVKDPITGKLIRRVKHFSGYSLTSGRDSDSESSF